MITEREFLERTHLDRGTLEIWIRESWICPASTAPERAFTEMDLARANMIHDLKHNMGVNDEGLDVILHLIDQMHGLRRALAEALGSLRTGGGGSKA
ncbi:chaperone modulatory protein CbpM [Roseiarcus fermentans]|uniref:Chaperone modulatory protein CbpM n=1 Tax=Roseiarcus fermentans TaxID=1473586 RepID=A0A366EID2_9HYPH|nr:chaperone modulator CbpM [Roseiarcus fermentans]RBP02108.1 chaperone modulatory protein CbpM [Roseiarcus fermentans]